MSTGGSAIRGSRVGAGPMGEQDRGFKAERITVNYYCSAGHEYSPKYAANVDRAEIPELIDCPNCGLPAGQDKLNPPIILKHEPYKTHLAYVKERRTAVEARELLDEAVAAVRERRIRLAEEAKIAAKVAAKEAAKAASKKIVTKAATKPASKPEAKPTTKPAAKVIPKTTAKSNPKNIAKNVAKAAPASVKNAKPAAKAKATISKPASKPAAKSNLKSNAKNNAKPTKK